MISLAPYNCLRNDWIEQFYPEDLPEDWRLDYYANEYRNLFVPTGIHARTELELGEEFPAFERIVQQWTSVQQRVPLCGSGCVETWVAVEDASNKPEGVLAAIPLEQHSVYYARDERESIYLLESNGDLRQLRADFELIAASNNEQSSLVFLDASPAVLEQAKTLLTLLGQQQC